MILLDELDKKVFDFVEKVTIGSSDSIKLYLYVTGFIKDFDDDTDYINDHNLKILTKPFALKETIKLRH